MAQTVDVRPGASRVTSTGDGTHSAYSFSFGHHYDSSNTSHGPLVAFNDEVVQPGAGFAPHPHRGVEIVTWVVAGTLTHEDSTGARSTVRRGHVQRLSAGAGVVHSERNDDPAQPLRFVQSWLLADGPALVPAYDAGPVDDARLTGSLVPVASGRDERAATVRVGNPDAVLHVGRLAPGQAVLLPLARWLHLYVAGGSVSVEGVAPLREGDAVRLTGSGGQRVTADAEAELVLWELHEAAG